MATLMTDDVLDHFALRGTLEEIPDQIASRFAGRVDRIGSYFPLPDYEPDRLAEFISAARQRCAEQEVVAS
jgi:hypothetical protein